MMLPDLTQAHNRIILLQESQGSLSCSCEESPVYWLICIEEMSKLIGFRAMGSVRSQSAVNWSQRISYKLGNGLQRSPKVHWELLHHWPKVGERILYLFPKDAFPHFCFRIFRYQPVVTFCLKWWLSLFLWDKKYIWWFELWYRLEK